MSFTEETYYEPKLTARVYDRPKVLQIYNFHIEKKNTKQKTIPNAFLLQKVFFTLMFLTLPQNCLVVVINVCHLTYSANVSFIY